MKFVQDVTLQKLLVRHSDFDRLPWWTVLEVPVLDQRYILSTPHTTGTTVVRLRSPPKRDSVGGKVVLKGPVIQERLKLLREFEVVVISAIRTEDGILMRHKWRVLGSEATKRNWVDERVEVERGEVGIIGTDVDVLRSMVGSDMDGTRERVVEMREGDAVLRPDLLPDDDLVDVVELVPILIEGVHVAIKRLKLGTTRDGHVERLRRKERLLVEQVGGITVRVIGEESPT